MNKLLKKILLIFTLVGVSSVLIACRPTAEMNKDVKITPSEFFQGDTALLEPHLKMTASAVNLDYTGDKENLNLQYEIWEEGELTTDEGIILTSISENASDQEISFSLTESPSPKVSEEALEMTIAIHSAEGYYSSKKIIEAYSKDFAQAQQQLPNELYANDDEKIVVWGLTAGEQPSSGNELIEETVKAAKWGLLIKLSFE